MSKLFKVLIMSVLCTSAAKLCHAYYIVRIQQPASHLVLDPIKMQKKQRNFQKICIQLPSWRQYGSPKLMESLDTGRIWPKQRRKIRHQTLDKLKERFDRFSDPVLKQKAIINIYNRIITLKKSIY